MSLPDYALLCPHRVPKQFDGFPARMALLPNGMTLAGFEAHKPPMAAAFLIERDCGNEVLNDPALDRYLQLGFPVLLHARRGRDMRPIMRRTPSFLKRGYTVEVLS